MNILIIIVYNGYLFSRASTVDKVNVDCMVKKELKAHTFLDNGKEYEGYGLQNLHSLKLLSKLLT